MKKILSVHTLIEPTIEDLVNMRKKIEKTYGKDVTVFTNMITTPTIKVIVFEENGKRFVDFK